MQLIARDLTLTEPTNNLTLVAIGITSLIP